MGAGDPRRHPRYPGRDRHLVPAILASRYVKDELRIAEAYGRRVYPFWVAGDRWIESIATHAIVTVGNVEFIVLGVVGSASAAARDRAVSDASFLALHEA